MLGVDGIPGKHENIESRILSKSLEKLEAVNCPLSNFSVLQRVPAVIFATMSPTSLVLSFPNQQLMAVYNFAIRGV